MRRVKIERRPSWQCTCGRYAERECDWEHEDGRVCAKPVCLSCLRVVEGFELCPFHRGDPPQITERKKREAEDAAARAGQDAAREAARILGVKL